MALDTPTLQLQIAANLTGTALEGSSPTYPLNVTWAAPLTTGTGASQADKIYAATITLGISSGQDIDLAGVLTDPFGVALTFVKIKAVGIKAAAANTNSVNVSRPAANGVPWFLAASDGFALGPGGIFPVSCNPGAAGIATVTAGTGGHCSAWTTAAPGRPSRFDIVVIGTSA
jgi:hypothetical protein